MKGAIVAPKVTHRAAITDAVAFGGLLRAIEAFDGQPATKAALRLLPLVFPGIRTAQRPIGENTLNAAMRRVGYDKEEVTSHGFRATASTLLNESGKFSPDAIERALAHQDPDATRRTYARGAFWQERVTMAQWWADHLDTLRDGAKIIPIHRKEK